MFSVSTSVVLLVFFVSQAVGQSASTVGPSVNSSVCSSVNSSVSPSVNSSMSPSVNSSVCSSVNSSVSPSVNSSVSPSVNSSVSPSVNSSVCPSVNSSMSGSVNSSVKLTSTTLSTPSSITAPTETPTKTVPPSKKTCAKLGVVIDKSWSDGYGNSTSKKFRKVSDAFSSALNNLYSDSAKYDEVEVSENFTNKEGKLFAEAELRLVFKGGDAVFIEDVFKKKVATGELDADLPVVKGSAEFEPLGVSWKDGKAKKGECKKCEETGGPFSIVRECQDKRCSCKGLKEKSEETKDCTKHCSSTVAVTVSSVILVIGILLSSSFQ